MNSAAINVPSTNQAQAVFQALFPLCAGVSVILGIFKLVMTSVAALFVDSWGRRPLLLLGVSNLVVALSVLGGVAFVPSADMLPWLAWVNVVALLLYVGAYQVSFRSPARPFCTVCMPA